MPIRLTLFAISSGMMQTVGASGEFTFQNRSFPFYTLHEKFLGQKSDHDMQFGWRAQQLIHYS
jgi:hypothetical protein